MAKTSSYYKKNPKAAAKRRKQQAKYNKTPKGLAIRVNANKLNKKLGTYGNRDGRILAMQKVARLKERRAQQKLTVKVAKNEPHYYQHLITIYTT